MLKIIIIDLSIPLRFDSSLSDSISLQTKVRKEIYKILSCKSISKAERGHWEYWLSRLEL